MRSRVTSLLVLRAGFVSVPPPHECLLRTARANLRDSGSACGLRQALLLGFTSSFHFPGVLPAPECAQQRCLLGQGCSAAILEVSTAWTSRSLEKWFLLCLFWTVPLVLLSSRLPGRWGALVLPALLLPQLLCLPQPRAAGWRDGVERAAPGSGPWGCCRAAGVHCTAVTAGTGSLGGPGRGDTSVLSLKCPKFPMWLLWQGCSYPYLCARLLIPLFVHMSTLQGHVEAQLCLQSR